jgi:hypothetical protein
MTKYSVPDDHWERVEDENPPGWKEDTSAADFVDLPLRVRRRVAAVLNRDLAEITPDERVIHREDGTGIADRGGSGDITPRGDDA